MHWSSFWWGAGMFAALLFLIVVIPGPSQFRTRVTQLRGTAGKFAGINDAFDAGATTVQVLVVHGMGTPAEGHRYAIALGQAIADETGFTTPAALEDEEIPATNLPEGARSARIHRQTYKNDGKQLIVHAVSWWPLVDAIKKRELIEPDQRH